jgi:hypothetical protein
MSSFSSSQMEAMALAAAEAEGGIGSGLVGSGGPLSGLSAALSTPQPKKTAWGWLNSLASVLPGNKPSHSRSGIDHDSEAVLTRAGSNAYEASLRAAAAAEARANGGGIDDEFDADGFAISPSPSASASRKGTAGGGDLDGNGTGDEAEEKSPERMSAEQDLADYFDALTGRIVPTNNSAGGAQGMQQPAVVTPSPGALITSPPPLLSSSSSGGGNGGGHPDAVTYSLARSRDLSAAELARSDALFATPEGRKAFASVLNRQRNTSGGLRLPGRPALERLAAWTRRFLDHARESMHANPTQLVMIMSQSFFVEEEEDEQQQQHQQQEGEADGAAAAAAAAASPTAASRSKSGDDSAEGADDESSSSGAAGSSLPPNSSSIGAGAQRHRVYLLSLLLSHPLWRDLRFWEESFFAAYNSKIRRSSAARVHKWHSDAEQAEGMHTRKQVCFSTLSTFAHNMSEFGMSASKVVGFVEKIAGINELEDEQVDLLRSMGAFEVHRREEALRRRNSDARLAGDHDRDSPSAAAGGRHQRMETGSPSSRRSHNSLRSESPSELSERERDDRGGGGAGGEGESFSASGSSSSNLRRHDSENSLAADYEDVGPPQQGTTEL